MGTGNGPRRSYRRPALAGIATVVALLTAACGSRMSHDAIVAASGGQTAGSVPGQPGAQPSAGAASGSPLSGGTSGGGVAGPASVGTTSSGTAVGGTTSGGTSSRSQSGTSGGAAQPTGAPLVIASVGDYSGIAGASEKDGPKALQVWAAWVNDHGGVNGHPVKVYVVDDGMDPQRYQAAVKDLVENKHVIAFVDNFAPFTIQAGVKYLEDKRVPVIGGDCAEYVWNQSPMLFPQYRGGPMKDRQQTPLERRPP